MTVLVFMIKVLFAALEFFAGIILSLSIFRIPFKYHYFKAAVAAVTMAAISSYFRDYVSVDWALLSVIAVEIVLIMLIFNIPIYYSVLICTIGFICGALCETFLIFIGSGLGLTSQQQIAVSTVHLCILETATAAILFLIVAYLQLRKIGFQFMLKHLSLRETLRGYNFYLSALLALGMIGMQLELLAFKEHSIKIYSPILLSVVFFVGIVVAYIHNRNMIKMKYERLARHEPH